MIQDKKTSFDIRRQENHYKEEKGEEIYEPDFAGCKKV